MSTATTDDRRSEPADPPPADPLAAVVARARRILEHGPKDDDYLPIPDQSRQDMDWHIAEIKARDGFVVNDADRLWLDANQALYDLYGGKYIATLRTDRGVVVLAVGGDEVSAIYAALPPAARPGLVTEHP
ncbi:MAG: hypothetical protein K2X87_22680 [Gemmataceae bacterium]|nr:hypothetical protein [Gemmataceae bacterium]